MPATQVDPDEQPNYLLRLEPELKKRAVAAAAARGMPLSAFIRMAIQNQLQRDRRAAR